MYTITTYNPYQKTNFDNIKQSKEFMLKYSFENNISVGKLDIDKKTINLQITEGNTPLIRLERN